MVVYGKGTQGFAEQLAMPIGGTNTALAHSHLHKEGGSNGSGNTTWFMITAKTLRDSTTIFRGNVHFPNIDHKGGCFKSF